MESSAENSTGNFPISSGLVAEHTCVVASRR